MITPEYYPGNTLTVGATRTGKSYSEIQEILAAALAGYVAIVVVDPHAYSLAWQCLVHLVAHGLEHRIIYDRLSYLETAPGYRFLRPSEASTPLLRLAENEQAAHEFGDVLSRRREMKSLATSPQTEEWLGKAALLVLNQKSHMPASDLRFAFEPRHAKFAALLKNCGDEDTRFEFNKVKDGSVRAGTYGPAKRLIDGVCRSAPFIVRSGISFDVGRFLDRRGILLVEGSTEHISEDAARSIMGAIILQVIQYVRKRNRSTPRVLLVLDEATNASLIGASGHEVRAMAELQKAGLDVHVLVQQLDFPTLAITRAILNNCAIHKWFFAADDSVARAAASDLGDAEYRQKVRDLKTGQCFIKNRQHVLFHTVPKINDSWGFPDLADAMAEEALERIRTRPEYEELQCQQSTLSEPESETGASSPSPPSTSVSSDTSSVSSPAVRLRTAGSRSSGNSES